jgi:threonine/homoserine/homoserine lactone efflux protein
METVFLVLPLLVLTGSMSPGPSFVVVARAAAAENVGAGVRAAVGMGLGSVIFSTAALLGFATLLESSLWIYLALKVVGAAYLMWLAVRLWRGASEPLEVAETPSKVQRPRRWLTSAFGIQITNPKTAMFYVSVFASLIPTHIPLWTAFVLPLLVFVIETGWYSVVAFAFSRRSARTTYRRAKAAIDRAAAVVVGALGVRLAVTLTHRGM